MAEVLEVYFRQCAILVTARDIAVMAATLANRGINPVTGERVMSAYAISRTLSVMTSSGMYDYAGEWIYRVGILLYGKRPSLRELARWIRYR